jgi:AcrR family transcriptional regulator
MEEKERILEFAEEKFFREGFYKTSMDEIASGMGISKKTIYKYFESKDQLLNSIVEVFTRRMSIEIESIIKSDRHAIEKIIGLTQTLKKILIKISDRWLNDIRVHRPSVWKTIEEFRTRMIARNISIVFSQGISEGYIIDVPPSIVITVFVSSVRAIINPEFIMNNSISALQAVEYTFKILFNGILTEEGREAYNKIVSQKGQV